MSEIWDFLQSPASSAALNMAVDEALLSTAANRRRPLLRIYSWQKPSVSFGYFQKFPAHLAGQYDIVRRPTGGGVVYHGEAVETTYTVVVPPDHRLFEMTAPEAYAAIHQAVAVALADCRSAILGATAPALAPGKALPQQRNAECFENPVAGDVLAGGRKLAGGAQRRNKRGMLHQGSIAALVTSEQLAHGFGAELGARFEPYWLTDEERLLAECFARNKYATHEWNRRIC